jgi:hypothetical protein
LHGKATASILCGVSRHAKKETVAVGASIAHERVAGEAAEHEDAEEALFAAARAHAEAMIAWAGSEQSLALEHEQLESETMKAGFEFMRLLAQAHLDLRAAREQRRDDVTGAGGDARTICEDGHERVRVMIYGPVTTSRIAYRKKGKENLYPQDAELNWGQQAYSAGIIRRNAEAVATAPFGQAAAQVSAQGAIRLGKRQSEELAVATATDFGAFYASRRPEPCDPETGLLLTADGSAFPVLPGALRPATAKAAAARAAAAAASGCPDDPGELRRSRKRMAELAAVADIPPAPRTPGDIIAALFGTRHGSGSSTRPAPGPEAAGKTMFASVRKPAGEVIAEAFAEAHRRDSDHLRPWFAVVDGNNHQIETITTLAADYQVTVPILIDLIHVTHYLWKAANSFFYTGDPEARAWVRDQTAKILDGKHRDVRAGIRRRATACGYSPAERAGADECADYLEHKQDYLDYPAFLTAGWPVASGLIEGAARWIVKDRMEVTGARWGLDGAEAVLKLRALHGTGDLGDYLDYHFQQEKHRNHDSRYQHAQELAA